MLANTVSLLYWLYRTISVTLASKGKKPPSWLATSTPVSYTHLDVYKRQGMYKLNVGSYALATVARALVAVAGYTGTGDVKMMLLFTAIAALGQGPWQGDMNAVIASCSEYTWLTKHKRVDRCV